MNIINLTPHVINILRMGPTSYEEVLSVPPSGMVARLEVARLEVENIMEANEKIVGNPIDGFGGIAFYESKFGAPVCQTKEGEVNFPPQKEGTIYIVSSLFRSGFDREDLWVPGELIRDGNGDPVGCLGLSR